MKHDSISPDEKAAALLRVASYLGRPQQFMAIADARAEMRRTSKKFLANFSFTNQTDGELGSMAGCIMRREGRAGTTVGPHIVIRKAVTNGMRSLLTLNHLCWCRMKANLMHRAIKCHQAICVRGHR
jgi:hypothetical protein